jgi:hypothetical protein
VKTSKPNYSISFLFQLQKSAKSFANRTKNMLEEQIIMAADMAMAFMITSRSPNLTKYISELLALNTQN